MTTMPFSLRFEEEKAASKADDGFTIRRASGGERNNIEKDRAACNGEIITKMKALS